MMRIARRFAGLLLTVTLVSCTSRNEHTTVGDDSPSTANRFHRQAGRGSVSPDGTQLLFTHRLHDGGEYRELFVSEVDGRDVTRLTLDRLDKKAPAWSPDGTRIAYQVHRGSDIQIFVVEANGSNPTQLTGPPGSSLEPGWSPDGGTILFYSDRESETFQIFSMRSDGTAQRRVRRSSSNDRFPRVSSTKRVVFVSDRGEETDLYLMNMDGSGLMRLTSMPGFVWGPSWSPDGKTIAFSSNVDDPDLDQAGNHNIYLIDANGENLRRLTANPGQELFPTWFPNGRKIVFGSDLSGGWTVHTLDLDDREIERVDLRE